MEGERGKGEGRGEGKGGAPPPLVQFGLPMGGGAASPCGLPPISPMAHVGPLLPRGVPVTPRCSEKYPNHSDTIPVCEYHLPIYQSLPLDHFETPRHVRDLIRDSEQSSVTKNT